IAGGVDNYRNLLLFLSDLYCSTAFCCEEPRSLPDSGLYHPLAEDRIRCAYMALPEFQKAFWRNDAPAIGILLYRAHWESSNLAVVDAIVDELEKLGANVLPVFCYSLRADNTLHRFFGSATQTAVDCLISNLNYASVNLQHGERVTSTT